MKKLLLLFILIISAIPKVFGANPFPGCECRDLLVDMNILTFQVLEGCSALVEYKSGDCNGFCSVSIEKVTLSDSKYKDSIQLWKLMDITTKLILQDVAKKTICSISGEKVLSFDIYMGNCISWDDKKNTTVECYTTTCCKSRYELEFMGEGKSWKINLIMQDGFTRCEKDNCFSICQ